MSIDDKSSRSNWSPPLLLGSKKVPKREISLG
jgi:hypothetical protein